MLDPKQMQAFCTLAEHMHFGRAAKALGVSQSTLSTQIRALEEALGAPLINRTNRTLTLTKLGETFLADARNILAMMECALKNTSDILDGTAATLRLGVCTGTINSGILGRLLAKSSEQFPKLELLTVEEPPATLLSELCEGHLDVVLTTTKSLDIPNHVVSVPISEWQATLIAHKRFALTNAEGDLNVEAVSKLPFYVFEHHNVSPRVIEHIFSFKPRRITRLPSVRLIASYVDQGLGAAIVPNVDTVLLTDNTACYPIPGARMPVRAMRLVNSNSPMMIRFFHMLNDLSAELETEKVA